MPFRMIFLEISVPCSPIPPPHFPDFSDHFINKIPDMDLDPYVMVFVLGLKSLPPPTPKEVGRSPLRLSRTRRKFCRSIKSLTFKFFDLFRCVFQLKCWSPSYLTERLGTSLFPSILIFRSISIFFLWDP